MTSSTEQYTAAADQLRSAAEKSADLWKQGARTVSNQAELASHWPTIDLSLGVQRYFELVQASVDVHREFVTQWITLVQSLTDSARQQAEKVSHLVTDQADKVADAVTDQADSVQEIANQQAAAAEEAEKERAREARRAERAAEKQAKEAARQPYEGLTKAELADRLSERELPKTGTVDELIERLIDADTN